MHIDTTIGGYTHDLRLPSVSRAVVAIAASPLCLGTLVSVPCDSWSAIKFNETNGAPGPERDTDNVLGIPLPDGSIPLAASFANVVTEVACDAAEACAAHNGCVAFESPVSRAAGSPFAIPGREKHASFWTHPRIGAITRILSLHPVFFDQCMSGCAAMKTTQLSCTPNLAAALHRNFAPLHCDGAHQHASLLGGRDVATGAFPSKATAAYTGDTCDRLADAFVQSSSSLGQLPTEPIPLPLTRGSGPRETPIANVTSSGANDLDAAASPAPASACPLADWAVALGIGNYNRTSSSVAPEAAHVFAAREDRVADLELQLARTDTNLDAEEQATVVAALASISSADLDLDDLRDRLDTTELAMQLLRDVAPLNGQALRPDFLFESGLDDNIFAAVNENFAGDNPSYRAAINGVDYKEWADGIAVENDNLIRNDVYERVAENTLPTWDARRGFATEVVGSMYVLRRKRDELNKIIEFKARIVVMGNVQKAKSAAASGVPLECFSPTVRPTTFKSQCAVAVQDGRRVQSFDVDGAYLQGEFPEGRSVYIRSPPGLQSTINGVRAVWRLKVPLYG